MSIIKEIKEGKAQINIFEENKISRKMPVFYNPVMKFNRDVALLLLNAMKKKDMNIALPFAGTGVRGVRILKELPSSLVKEIHINDISIIACEKIRETIELNSLSQEEKSKISISCKDADLFFEESQGFDYIDIDPFGNPSGFLPAAIKKLSRNGIIAVTATDTSALTGTYKNATARKYWSVSMRNELMHELSVRILVRFVQMIGAMHDKALTPIYSYAKDHYVRAFFICSKGRQKVDAIIKEHKYIVYDKMETQVVHADEISKGSLYAGPLWVGQLWDSHLAEEISKNNLQLDLTREEQNFLNIVAEESKICSVGFIDLAKFSKIFKKSCKTNFIIDKLKKNNIAAARTHFSDNAIRTTVSAQKLITLLS